MHLSPGGCKDEVQLVDNGFGKMMKHHIGAYTDEWLEDKNNLNTWIASSGEGGLTTSEKRVLVTQWVGAAYLHCCATFNWLLLLCKNLE